MAEENEIQKTEPIPVKPIEKEQIQSITETPLERLLLEQVKFLKFLNTFIVSVLGTLFVFSGVIFYLNLNSAETRVEETRSEVLNKVAEIDPELRNLLTVTSELKEEIRDKQQENETRLDDRFNKLAGEAINPAKLVFKNNGVEFKRREITVEYTLVNDNWEWLSIDGIFFQIHNIGGESAQQLKVSLFCNSDLFHANSLNLYHTISEKSNFNEDGRSIREYQYALFDNEKTLNPKEFLSLAIPINRMLNSAYLTKSTTLRVLIYSSKSDPIEAEFRLSFKEKK